MSFEYYVYAYVRDDGTPYYIGKGKDRRAYAPHKRRDGTFINPPPRARIIFLEQNLSNVGACAIERRLIRWWGKKSNGGILTNMCDGGDGGGIPGRRLSEDQKRKISNSLRGKTRSPEAIEKTKLKHMGTKRSQESRQRMSKAQQGSSRSDEAKKNMSLGALSRPKVSCPHCSKFGDVSMMKRWHFDNCREKK